MSRFSIKLSSTILLLLASPLWAQDNLTARRPFGQHTTAFSATPVFDAGVTDNWKITLTGNVTGSTLVSPEAGHTYTWEICQDATGSRTFVWPSQLVSPISISATANACTTEIFYFDGTNGVIPTTTTGGGGGSGTVNSGTVNQIGKYTAATTVSSDANLDDGLTNANGLTYLGSGGIYASTYNATGTGAMTFVGAEGTCSGATVGKDVPCFGDLTSHSAQISNNGDSFRSFATHQSTSPTPHGIMLAETFPQMFAAPRGTQGQPFLEGSGAGDPGYGQLDLSLATNVINRLVKANQTASTVYNDQVNTFTAAGTLDLSASTVASSLRVANGAGITCIINGALCYDTTSNNFHAGMNSADSIIPVVTTLPANNDCLKAIVTSGNLKIGSAGVGPCGSGGSVRWDQITAATGAFTTANGDNPFSIQFAATTAGRSAFELTESAAGTSTGTSFLFNVHTLASSTLNPCQFTARGTANGIRCDSVSGSLTRIGTAHIDADQLNGTAFAGSNGDLASFGAANIPADSGILASNVVRKDAANTAAAAMTLDLSAATGATAFKVPVLAGCTAGADGVSCYDSTNKNQHVRTNGADSIVGAFASAPATGNVVDTLVASSNTLLHDSGVATANLTTQSSNGAANQVCTYTGANKTCVPGTVTGAMMTSATVTATQLAAQYSVGSCTEVWGGTGASFALASGDDSISNNTCYNDSGVTRTITAVKCRSDNASNTTTVNPTFGSAGTGTTILSGALTCGSSLAYSSSGTVSNASWTTGTGINPVQGGTLTGTSIAVIVEYTY